MYSFIENYFSNNKNAKQLAKESSTFSAGYKYWVNVLFERAVRLFVWKGPDEDGVPQKEIEICTMMTGTSGVTNKYKDKLAVFNGYFCGTPTVYYDIFENFSVYSPVYSDILTVNKDVAVICNNALKNSIYPLVHRYAIMLAHTEVSYVNTLINGRDSGGVPIASTEAQRKSIENYRNGLCNGTVGSILDPAFSGVQFLSVDKNTTLNIKDLLEARENLLNAFYADLGIKTAWNKKGNMIREEVSANDAMLLLNIDDMLHSRQQACEQINKMFGTNWSVDKAEELKYDKYENISGGEINE